MHRQVIIAMPNHRYDPSRSLEIYFYTSNIVLFVIYLLGTYLYRLFLKFKYFLHYVSYCL